MKNISFNYTKTGKVPERPSELEVASPDILDKERTKISLRLRNTDLRLLKERAMREGMPYQTLIGSILHKAVS